MRGRAAQRPPGREGISAGKPTRRSSSSATQAPGQLEQSVAPGGPAGDPSDGRCVLRSVEVTPQCGPGRRPARGIGFRAERRNACLITTLTRDARGLTDYCRDIRWSPYLQYSGIHSIERIEIIQDLPHAFFDALIGVPATRRPRTGGGFCVAISRGTRRDSCGPQRSLIQRSPGRPHVDAKPALRRQPHGSIGKAISETERGAAVIPANYNENARNHPLTPAGSGPDNSILSSRLSSAAAQR